MIDSETKTFQEIKSAEVPIYKTAILLWVLLIVIIIVQVIVPFFNKVNFLINSWTLP